METRRTEVGAGQNRGGPDPGAQGEVSVHLCPLLKPPAQEKPLRRALLGWSEEGPARVRDTAKKRGETVSCLLASRQAWELLEGTDG